MKINQLKTGVIISYATQGVHILTGLIYTPIMLRLLGQGEYGLYQLVFSVVSYLGLLSFGFGSSYMRFYSRYKVNNDEEGIARLNGIFIIIFSAIALICLLCGWIMVVNTEAIFGTGLTHNEIKKAKILLSLMVFNLAVSFVNSVFSSNITAHECFFFQRILEFFRALCSPFLTLPLLLLNFGSVGMVSVTTFLTVVVFVLNIIYCVKKLKIRFSFKHLEFSLFREMWTFTFYIFLNMIVDQLNWSIDKFLLGRMLGTVAVAVYGVAGQLNTMYLSFSTAVSSIFIPRVNILVASKNNDEILTKLFVSVGRIQFLILGLIISGYVFFGSEFIAFWAGDEYESSYIIGLFLMIPVTIPLLQNLGIEIQRAKNLHKARSVVYFFIAISNIFISIPSIKLWGTKGAAVGTAVSLLLGNGLFMNIYYHKRIKLNIILFWREIAKFIPSVIIVAMVGLAIQHFMPIDCPMMLVVDIIAYCLAYLGVMWFIGMNKYEKSLVTTPIKKILKK